MAKVLGRVITGEITLPRGPDASHRIRVPKDWLEKGSVIELELPRNLVCRKCEGGGCDACDRSGAVTLRARGERGDVDAVLPESEGSGRGVEPLCAWYSSRCLPAVTAALDAGDRRVVAFHGAVRVARLSHTEVAGFGDPARMFANVNTREDLARLEELARAHA